MASNVTSGDEKYMRLYLPVKKLGIKYCLQVFNQHFPRDSSKTKIQQAKHLFQQIQPYRRRLSLGNLFKEQKLILFGSPNQETEIEELDLTLILKILKVVDPNNPDLDVLRGIRNWLAHYGSKELSPPVYEQKLGEIKTNLMNLGATSDEVDYFETCKLDVTDKEKSEILIDLLRESIPIPNDVVLYDVLTVTSKEIKLDWEKLATSLQMPASHIKSLDSNGTTEEKMMACFKYKFDNISWQDLKTSLIKINRKDIVDKLRDETCLTANLKEASDCLRKLLTDRFSHVLADGALEETGEYAPQLEGFVDLVLANKKEFDKTVIKCDTLYHLSNNLLSNEYLKIEDTIRPSDKFTILRGITGIGKTFLSEHISYLWSTDQILSGKRSPKIDFLFHITCFQIPDNITPLLESLFPDVFKKISLSDLSELGHKVLILFDGMDEIEVFESSRRAIVDTNLAKSVYEVFRPDLRHIPNSFTCITGRPEVCHSLFELAKSCIKTKVVDVIGFNDPSIDRYLKMFFKNCNGKIEQTKRLIAENHTLRSMSCIPAYLWIFCSLIKSETSFGEINTTTAFCITASLLFIRDYSKQLNLKGLTLRELSQHKTIINTISCIAQLAFDVLKSDKFIFYEADVANRYKDILKHSGLISKFKIGQNGFGYQFRHLIFAEYFAGLHIFLMGKDGLSVLSEVVGTSSHMLSVLPTIFGLEGILHNSSDSNNYLFVFVNQLLNSRKNWISRTLSMNRKWLWNGFVEHVCKIMTERIITSEENIASYSSAEDWNVLLLSLCEYQGELPQSVQEYFALNRDIDVITIDTHLQVQNIAYLFNKLQQDVNLNVLYLIMLDKVITDNEIENMETLINKPKLIVIYDTNLNWDKFFNTFTVNDTFHNLEALVLSSCNLDDNDKLIIFGRVPYLSSFGLINISLSNKDVDLLAKRITMATGKQTNKLKGLMLFKCYLNDEHVKQLTPCVKVLEWVNLFKNPEISSKGIKMISDSITETINAGKECLLKELLLSHLTDDHVYELLPILSHLPLLQLAISSNLTLDCFVAVAKSMKSQANTFSQLQLVLDVDSVLTEDLSKEMFKDVEEHINITHSDDLKSLFSEL